MEKSNLKHSILSAAVVASAVGFTFYNVMPLYLGTLMEDKSFSYPQIGYVASAFFLGVNVMSALSFFWIRIVPPRISAFIALLVLSLFLLLGTFFSTYSIIFIMTVVVGLASGVLASLAATIIGDTKDATRWFGIKTAAESAAGVILLFLLPVTLISYYGFNGVVYGMLLFIVLLSPVFFFLPNSRLIIDDEVSFSEDKELKEKKSSLAVWLCLMAFVFNFTCGAGIWAFTERIASANQFEPAVVGVLLGVTLSFCVIGPLISGSIGDKFGKRVPYVIALILMLLGIIGITSSDQFYVFAIGACLSMLGWAGSLPFLFSMVASADPDGRHIVFAPTSVGVGSMVGPALAGNVYSGESTLLLLLMCVVGLTLSAFCGLKGGGLVENN
jgi:MFS family permease